MKKSSTWFISCCARFMLSIGLLAGCGGSPDPPDASGSEDAAARFGRETSALTVMTFNIRYDNPDDGRHAWPNRRDHLVSLIKFYRPDLLGVQEALHGQMQDLADRLPSYEWFGRGRGANPTDGEYSAVFYRPDRLELLDHQTFWLSPTPDEPESVGWDAALPRIVTWGRLTDRATGATFYHFNTHLDHEGDTARARSVELIAERIGAVEGNHPVILTGDFNFTPDERPYRILSARLQDAKRASEARHFGPDGTYGGFEVSGEMGPRIDYIWTTDQVEVLRHGTITDHRLGDYPSDHLPVLAVVLGKE